MFMVMLFSWLAFLFAIVCMVSYVWFVVLGFKRSILWGFGLLFFQPITTIVYAVKNWDEARRPTWVCVTGTAGWIACFAIMIFAGVSSATEFAAQMEESGFAQEFAQVEAAPADDSTEIEEATQGESWEGLRQQIVAEIGTGDEVAIELPDADDLPADALPSIHDGEVHADLDTFLPAVGRRTADGYLTVSLGEADRYVGDVARLVQKNGREYRGLLSAANNSRVLMERSLGGGTFVVEFSAREIQSLAVLPNP